MEMTGEQIIALPQADVWRGLNDPEILRASLTGCESIELTGENQYKVAMTAAVGPVKAKFAGKLALSDIVPPDSYSITFEGSGGAAGFVKGSAQVALAPAPEGPGTKLTYSAKANIGGKLAQVGARLIDGVARKQADDFFKKFNEIMAASAPAAPAAAATPAAASSVSAAAMPAAASESEPFNPLWFVAGTIIVMMLIYWGLGPDKYIS